MSKKANKLIEGCLVRFADPAALVASRRTGSSYFSVPQLCTSGGLPSNAAHFTTPAEGAKTIGNPGTQGEGARKGPRRPGMRGGTIHRVIRWFRRSLRWPYRPDHALAFVVPAAEAFALALRANILRKSGTGSTTLLTTRGAFRSWARRCLSGTTALRVLRIRSLPEILWCRIDPLDRQTPEGGASLLTVSSFALPSCQCQFS